MHAISKDKIKKRRHIFIALIFEQGRCISIKIKFMSNYVNTTRNNNNNKKQKRKRIYLHLNESSS